MTFSRCTISFGNRLLPGIVLAGAALVLPASVEVANAQEIRAVGVLGERDQKGRSPDLGVRVVQESGRVKILADAHIPNSDYAKLPIRFDFFINRRLFSSQIRSSELPGAVGVDVGPDIAVPPFNYTVVATALSPNGRHPTTVLNGAVFESQLVTTLDCTLVLNSDDELDSLEFVANDVETNQVGNASFELAFEEASVEDDADIKASIAVSVVEGTEANAVLTYTLDEDASTTQSVNLSGTAAFDGNNALDALNLSSTDGATTVRCS